MNVYPHREGHVVCRPVPGRPLPCAPSIPSRTFVLKDYVDQLIAELREELREEIGSIVLGSAFVSLVTDSDGGLTAATVGTRAASTGIGPRSFTVGDANTASGGNSFAQGRSCQATGLNSVALGYKAFASYHRSFVWNGVEGSDGYGATKPGTFHVNPVGEAAGFFIGTTPLSSLLAGAGTTDYEELTNKPTINGTVLLGNKTAADLGLATADDVAKKRDKTDNIVAADEVVFSEWKFTSDDPVVNAALAPGGWGMGEDFDGTQKYWLFSGPGIDGYEQSMVSLYHISELSVSGDIYTRLADGEMITVTATRTKIIIAKEGESYVSPTGVTSLTADKMPKYGFADVAVADSTLTLTPFSRNAYSGSETFTVLMGGETGKVRDCVFVVTAGGTAPTISWGVEDGVQKFAPRTDAATDMEIAANTTKVFWVSEYAEDKFVVAGWEVPSVSE